MKRDALKHYAAIALISAVPLAVIAIIGSEQWVYVAASILLLYLSKNGKLAVCLLAGIAIATKALNLAITWIPHTYDAALWRLDGSLGVDPSAYAMATLVHSPVLFTIAKSVYMAFPIGLAAAMAFGRDGRQFAVKVVAACTLGYLAQLIVPACGPLYFITGSTATAPRNAMPSLHFTWALLVWRELRGLSLPGRVLADVFLIFTVISTIGSGEHYVVDLIVAVPFWMAMEHLCPVEVFPSPVRLNRVREKVAVDPVADRSAQATTGSRVFEH